MCLDYAKAIDTTCVKVQRGMNSEKHVVKP